MKPECLSDDGNSAELNKASSTNVEENYITTNDSKTKNEEIGGLSSELLSKINTFIERNNSFLYEDVLENASTLAESVSVNPNYEEKTKMNGNCAEEDEISENVNSRNIYSSVKRYCLRNGKKKTNLPSISSNTQSMETSLGDQCSTEIGKSIPDSFQLPVCHETQTIVTLDTSFFENRKMIDTKLQATDTVTSSQDLTDAQKSIRLKKRSTSKNKKKSSEKLVALYKTKKCFSPTKVFSKDVTENPQLENPTPVSGNLKILPSVNSFYSCVEDEKLAKKVHVMLVDFLHNSQPFKEQLKEKSDVSCLEKALSELSTNYKQSEAKTVKAKSCKDASTNVLKKLNAKMDLKSKTLSSALKKSNSKKMKDKTHNTVLNQTSSPEISTNPSKENLCKKNNLKISNHLAEKSALSMREKGSSPQKSVKQNNSAVKVKFEKKNTPKKKAALENGDIFNKNIIVNDEDLIRNKEYLVESYKNHLKQESKSMQLCRANSSLAVSQKSCIKKNNGLNHSGSASPEISQLKTSSFHMLLNKVVKESSNSCQSDVLSQLFQRHSTKLSSPKQSEEINKKTDTPIEKKVSVEASIILPQNEKDKKNEEPVKKNSKTVKNQTLSKEFHDEFYSVNKTTAVENQSSTGIATSLPSCRRSKRNQNIKKEINGKTFQSSNVSEDICTELHSRKEEKTRKISANNVAVSSSIISNVEAELSDHSESAKESASKRSRKRKLSNAESIKTRRLDEIKRKPETLISAGLEASHSNENWNDFSSIMVTEVKSLANLEEKMPSMEKRKSAAAKKCKKQLSISDSEEKCQRKRSKSDFSRCDSSLTERELDCTSTYKFSKIHSNGTPTRTKRKIKSTNVDPNFYYETRTPRAKKDVKSLDSPKRSIELHVKKSPMKSIKYRTDFITESSAADTALEEVTNTTLEEVTNEDQYHNANAIPPSNSFSIYRTHNSPNILMCHPSYGLFYGAFLAPPGHAEGFMPLFSKQNYQLEDVMFPNNHSNTVLNSGLYPSNSVSLQPYNYSNNIANGGLHFLQSPNANNAANSGLYSGNSHLLQSPNSILSNNVISGLYSGNSHLVQSPNVATTSGLYSGNAHSLQFSNMNNINSYWPTCNKNFSVKRTIEKEDNFDLKTSQTETFRQNLELKSSFNWQIFIKKANEKKIKEFYQIFDKDYSKGYTVEAFCTDIGTRTFIEDNCGEFAKSDIEDPSRLEYDISDSVLNEPFLFILKDFVYFYMDSVYEKIYDKFGDDLKNHFFSEVYKKCPVLICHLFGKVLLQDSETLEIRDLVAALSVIGIIYIVFKVTKILTERLESLES